MKYVSLLGLGLAISATAQVPETAPLPAPTPAAFPQAAQTIPALRTDADLETLLGPIALYPDALIALILPASTQPAEVVMAARFVEAKGTEEALAAQPWDDSVKALTHYPDVLRWLDQNLPWTQALGDSFTNQPIDTMNTVQRLRAKARANGTLVDNAQQRVVKENNSIVIVPTQPTVVYVPVYDPAVVYVSQPVYVGRPYIYYRTAYPTGPWLSYSFNWNSGNVRVISSPYPGWSRPGYRYPPNTPVRVWTPPPRRYYPPVQPQIPQPTVNRPYQPGWNRQPGSPPRQTPGTATPVRPNNWQQPTVAPGIQRPNSPGVQPQQNGLRQPDRQRPNQPRTGVNLSNPAAPNATAPVVIVPTAPATPFVPTTPQANTPFQQTPGRPGNAPAQARPPGANWNTAPSANPPQAVAPQAAPQTPQSRATYTERRQGRPQAAPGQPAK